MFQLTYTSKTTSTKEQLLVDLRNILSEARNFNVSYDVTGVLYFADGNFFQYLEGEKDILLILKDKLINDSRHDDLKFSEMKSLQQKYFNDWSMKYVKKNSVIQQYLVTCNVDGFNPQYLNQKHIDKLITLLVSSEACVI